MTWSSVGFESARTPYSVIQMSFPYCGEPWKCSSASRSGECYPEDGAHLLVNARDEFLEEIGSLPAPVIMQLDEIRLTAEELENLHECLEPPDIEDDRWTGYLHSLALVRGEIPKPVRCRRVRVCGEMNQMFPSVS